MIEIRINNDMHKRALTLKARVDKLDDLFTEYVENGHGKTGYLKRIIKAKTECRNEMGIILGVLI